MFILCNRSKNMVLDAGVAKLISSSTIAQQGGRHQLDENKQKSYNTNNFFRDWLPASFVETSDTTECWGMFFCFWATITDNFDDIFYIQ